MCYNGGMANDSGYIINFDNSSGLPPQVVAALNNNFRYLVNRFQDPNITAVSGVNPPKPRNNETLFYKIDNGDLYIWKHFDENQDYGIEDHWDWSKLDIGLIHVENSAPSSSTFVRQDEVIWYDTLHHDIYFWYEPQGAMGGARWYSIAEIIRGVS